MFEDYKSSNRYKVHQWQVDETFRKRECKRNGIKFVPLKLDEYMRIEYDM